MSVITLTTDFGSGDYEAGVLKGVIWQIAPQTRIADISHDIPPHDILHGAVTLWRAAPFFPANTIHVAVVDPGVGTGRRALAGRLGQQFFVGPDNGLFTLEMERAEEKAWPAKWVCLDRPEYWLPSVSKVFHGRDVFAPVAAHLANGVPLEALGTVIDDPLRLLLPRTQETVSGWLAQVIQVDHFGNLETNFQLKNLGGKKVKSVTIHGVPIIGVVESFGSRLPGELIALFDSSDLLSISVVNGNAAQLLGAGTGDSLEIILE